MNIIDAIINFINNPVANLTNTYVNQKNRANSQGDALEEYTKDLFAGTMNEVDKKNRIERFSEVFSYLGNNSNPPDFILKNGDAVEVKKVNSLYNQIALNSSYPKSKLLSSSTLLNKDCRECEFIEGTSDHWIEKDIIYSVGTMDKEKGKLISLVFVYGEDYAANNEVYENIKTKIRDGVLQINGVEFTKTKELGKVKKVDPLGITYLRIRGMWGIENPLKVFDYIYKRPQDKEITFMAIINKNKWDSFDNTDVLLDVIRNNENARIINERIQNPSNPAVMKDVVLITFSK